MSDTYYLLGGDQRQYWVSMRMLENGLKTETCGVPSLPGIPLPAVFGTDDIIILPFPSFQGTLLRGKSSIDATQVIQRTGTGTRVFGGLIGEHRAEFEARGAVVFDLYGSEPLTTNNAIPTAEGAIQLAIANSPIMLHGAHCLVIGSGRVGKILAQKLHALSAQVTLTARKPADCAMSEAFGMRSDVTGAYHRGLHQYDFIFNTVPSTVLSQDQLAALQPNCVLFELASKPGGISEEACKQLGLAYHFAPGLPGICAPATAGALYADSIMHFAE